MIFILAAALLVAGWKYHNLARQSGVRTVLTSLTAALLAGVPVGLLFGVLARLAMRLLAVGMHVPLRWTVSGSFAVLLIFAGMGIGLALFYPGLFRNERAGHPLLFATTLTVCTLQPFIRAAAQDLGASMWNPTVMIGATCMTIALWFPYAVVLEAAFSRIAPRMLNCGCSSIPAKA